VFTCADGRVALPLDRLEIKLGGASDRLIFFTHPERPDWSVYSDDHAILSDAHLNAHPAVAALLSGVRGRQRRGFVTTVAIVLAVLLGLWGLTWLKGPLARVVADNIPPAVERKIGDTIMAQMKFGGGFITDPAVRQDLDALVAPLMHIAAKDGMSFSFHIAQEKEVNAFALPGGHIVIHTALVTAAKTPEEVLGVLAHEMAHVTERHVLRGLIETAGLYLLVDFFLGDVSGLIAVAADQGAFLLSQKFSRDFERAADDVGWDFLILARVDPRGMIDFFRTLKAEQAKLRKDMPLGELENGLAFLSTHPATDERIERLAAKWEALPAKGNFVKNPLDFAAFQAKINALDGGINANNP
jgi:predicted Zn-dependent protease